MLKYKWTGAGNPSDYNDPRNWVSDDSGPPVGDGAPTPPPSNGAAYVYGATGDHGETDDPLTNDVTYSGTVYYIDSINGSDSNSGLSPDQAWKTLAQAESKIHGANPAPAGSAFLFNRGGTYTGHISVFPGAVITSQNNYTF